LAQFWVQVFLTSNRIYLLFLHGLRSPCKLAAARVVRLLANQCWPRELMLAGDPLQMSAWHSAALCAASRDQTVVRNTSATDPGPKESTAPTSTL
jgi:hypothetical protein